MRATLANSDSIRHYVYDGWQPIAVLNPDPVNDGAAITYTADQFFAWGPDLSGRYQGAGGIGGLALYIDEMEPMATRTFFPTYDGNGNVTALYRPSVSSTTPPETSSANVILAAAYEYGPFGEMRSLEGPQGARNPFRWSTKFTDAESGMVYYGYRYYNPSTGRWLSRDPIEERGGLNDLNFCHSDPVSHIDALGMDDYAEGPAQDPPRQYKIGFAYDPKETPKASDYYNWYYYGTLSFGARTIGHLPNARRSYDHYRDATGTDLEVKYDDAYRDDSTVREHVDNEIAAAQAVAEAIAKSKVGGASKTFNIYSRAIRGSDTATEDWQKTLGSHKIWGDGTVTYDACEKHFVMQIRINRPLKKSPRWRNRSGNGCEQ